jgi:two-component system osmolarity sensor histidine kinase EnvZ
MPILWVHNPPFGNKYLPGVLLVVVAAIVFGLLVAWQIQRPVRDMAEAAERLARRRDVEPIPERGPHELRQLAARFNHMMSEIAEADQERNTMLAGIAHDLKTPLARLRLRAEMLGDAKASAGVARDVDAMAAIVEQFLVFAQSGEPVARPVGVDRRIGELAAAQAEQDRDLMVHLEAGDGFRLTATQLDRIVGNLIDNAYAHGAPPVHIRTYGDAQGWHLIVEDHGPGIPAEAHDRVVRPFVRLDPARGGRAHAGLGLAIVDRLVRQSGGTLHFVNRAEGGLRVEMVFPATIAAAAV